MRKKIVTLIMACALAVAMIFGISSITRYYHTATEAGDIGAYTGEDDGAEGERAAKLLEGMGEVTQAEAAAAAAGFMGLRPSMLRYEGEAQRGGLPVYVFTCGAPGGRATIEVTKTGGFIARAESTRAPLSDRFPLTEAIKEAQRLLRENGFYDMTATEYMAEGNTVRVIFAYSKGGVTYYPDRIEVTIGRDNGGLVGFDSFCYIINRHERTLGDAKVAEKTAREMVSDRLEIKSHNMAVIARNGGEIYCHEFKCENGLGGQYLVRINAETGEFEQILVRSEGENGVALR